MRTIKLLITVVLLGLSYNSFACPPGYTQYSPDGGKSFSCMPSGGGDGGSTSTQQKQKPKNTWGAIAGDINIAPSFALASSGAAKFEWQAKQEAISECKKNGGKNCEIILSYKNQCVVVAGNIKGLSALPVKVGTAAEIKASRAAKANCLDSTGQECAIIFKACSHLPFKESL